MKHVENILGGLAVFLVVMGLIVGVFGGAFWTAHENNLKQQKMNTFCIAQGYALWDSGEHSNRYGNDTRDGVSGCVK